jgi:hypothetical protein
MEGSIFQAACDSGGEISIKIGHNSERAHDDVQDVFQSDACLRHVAHPDPYPRE